MKAVVVAAGEGTRMRPLTARRPKPLLPVAGRPIVEHVMDACADLVDGYVLVVGYRGDQMRDRIGEEFAGHPVTYTEQTEQLGTAHAIGQAADYVDERFLALNGDVLLTEELVTALAETPANAMAVKRVDDPSSFGVVDVEDGSVTGIVEKPDDPPSNLANLGVYAFESDIFDYIKATDLSERGEYEITDSLGSLVADGERVDAVEYDGAWLDVGRPWDLLDANETLLADLDDDRRGTIEEGATIHGPAVVEEGARIRAGAYVEGPVLIQSGADVGPNAYVRGSTVVGRDVRVGNAVEVKNSILMADTAVGHLSYVGDSILGEDVNFGAGTKVANLRHDDEAVEMRVKGEPVDTGRRKLGVVVGDGTKTGINASINAGVKLGANTTTPPGKPITRDTDSQL
ncbi:bifunctional sugar-1-phosphate nucleotidylyltransferase/acetyltransferase [Halobacterium wangiae]|uniref:bifunctional sugar-1-phosphate nucleotidylyltransferase/acetyltransferase n=1 Tax=Halobacterium wangiae TaxID=2902623 RepID=UPI001E4B3651|nr:bifunctional sugar-1-phosphate nucleotidylyltransferase/acetyltransferase [Halobacterium wangiae]